MSRKGKTYEEIYGEKADEERKKRSNKGVIVKAFRTKWCGCGCGGQFKEDSRYPRQFIRGHNARVNHGMEGKHHSEESNQKNCDAHLGKSPNHKPNCGCGICRAKRGELKGLTKETDLRVAKQAESVRKTWQDSVLRESQSIRLKQCWLDPEYIAKQMKTRMKAREVKPNKPEKFLTKLFQKLFPNQWKYVGNGAFWITSGGKHLNPDFVNINGQKKIIEHFGDFHHGEKRTGIPNEQHEQDRIDLFAKHGYQTLVIWEHELKDVEKLVNKLRKFSN
jgi:hypothetical protein